MICQILNNLFQIPETFWCPSTYIKTIVRPEKKEETVTHPLPEHNYQFHFPNSQGLAYEAAAVRAALMQSKRSS